MTTLYNCAEQKSMRNTLNLQADGLQQQNTSGSTSVSQEQKGEAAVDTGPPKVDS